MEQEQRLRQLEQGHRAMFEEHTQQCTLELRDLAERLQALACVVVPCANEVFISSAWFCFMTLCFSMFLLRYMLFLGAPVVSSNSLHDAAETKRADDAEARANELERRLR